MKSVRSSGDIAISWIRRTRSGGDNWELPEVPLGEESESYEVDILDMKAPYVLPNPPQFWGMTDEEGNLQLIANYNNDVGDFWKYLDHGDKPLADSSRAVRLGVNYVIYAMSH